MFLHTYNFPNLNIGDNFAFETSLSETPDESAVVSLLLKINAEIQPKKRLGFLVFKLHRKALYPKEVFPFGEGLYESKHQKGIIRFDTDSWRINLLGKGIASALEYLLLYLYLIMNYLYFLIHHLLRVV